MSRPIRFLSLFSGIGGIDLGFERAGMECVGQVEIDPYCRMVLKKHWPNVWRHDDVRTLARRIYDCGPENEEGEVVCQIHNREFGECECVGTDQLIDTIGTIDLICGGFPCQDISRFGKQAGITKSTRSGLWIEYHRIIGEIRPSLVVVENVPGLLDGGIGRVLGDLAEIGYDTEWDCIPACAVGAPHVRDRVFIVANDCKERNQRYLPKSVCRFSAFSWCEDVGGVEDLRNRPDLPPPIFCGTRDGVPDWVGRVAGCGNAVVPQVAEVIGRSIMESWK